MTILTVKKEQKSLAKSMGLEQEALSLLNGTLAFPKSKFSWSTLDLTGGNLMGCATNATLNVDCPSPDLMLLPKSNDEPCASISKSDNIRTEKTSKEGLRLFFDFSAYTHRI